MQSNLPHPADNGFATVNVDDLSLNQEQETISEGLILWHRLRHLE